MNHEQEEEIVYPRIVTKGNARRVQVSPKMYLPGTYTNDIYAEKAISSHLAKKARKRQSKSKRA